QSCDLRRGIAPVPGSQPRVRGEQSTALVISNRVDADTAAFGQCPNAQGFHARDSALSAGILKCGPGSRVKTGSPCLAKLLIIMVFGLTTLGMGMSMAAECIFCEILAGRAPADIAFEDEWTIAAIDLRQHNPGHVLVIPKAHINDIRELDE